MNAIIEVKNLGKKFRINSNNSPYLSLRERITEGFKFSSSKKDFWALKDVNFEIKEGVSMGIIGRNGAGKSTLLKILSKITPPTTGTVTLRGRIASLLEVGTGFHPELTGKENIYLNGSILGMKRQEINAKFDEIVDFSEIEDFISTPLKHYSSGMQLRLAFSVAAFLEPEIMIIDEVLAVGDIEFQKKCMSKMDSVSNSGRTILFVSHNMNAIKSLCSQSILLNNGTIEDIGESAQIIDKYLLNSKNRVEASNGVIEIAEEDRAVISKVEIFCDGVRSNSFYMGCQLEFQVTFKSDAPLEYPILGVIVRDSNNTCIIGVNNKNYVGNLVDKPISEGTISLKIPDLPFINGLYSVDIHFGNKFEDLEVKKDFFSFFVDQKRLPNAQEAPNPDYNSVFIKTIEWDIN